MAAGETRRGRARVRRLRRALELYGNQFIKRRTPVIVFSMERSGSVALYRSLLDAGLFSIATHYLTPEKVKQGWPTGNGSARWGSKHIILKGKNAKIISLVRDPIDNMVSTFARLDLGGQATGASADDGQQIDPEKLSRQFRTRYLESGRYRHPLTWFDTEFKVALGIDVYAHAFDKENGYGRIEQGPFDVLLIRTEMEDGQKSRLVGEFLDVPDFTMTRADGPPTAGPDMAPGRAGEQSTYGPLYKALKQHVTVPREYLDAIVESPYTRHFFPAKTLGAMRQRYRD